MSKKPFMGRDYLLLKIIGGATKAGVEPDRKKEANKNASRSHKMKRSDQGQSQAQANTMQLAELKHLKATLVIKDQRIKQLEDQLAVAINRIKDLQTVQVAMSTTAKETVTEVVKMLESKGVETLAKP